ncbi:hypothetical protein CLV39_1412, partial [Hydrogenothermus marinus]
MKTKKAISFELNNRLTDEQLIIIGHLTYHAGKLWNQANYLIQNKLAKPLYKDLYHKLKDSSVNLRSLHSRSAQIILDELSRAWNNFFNFLKSPESYKKKGVEFVKPPKYQNPNLPHRTITWDKTGFKIVGSVIRLSLSKSLKEYLKSKFKIETDYLWIDTGYKRLKELRVLNIQLVPYKAYGHLSYKLVVIYEEAIPKVEVKGSRVLAIDYGINNFATCIV